MPTEKELEHERHEAWVRWARDHRARVMAGGAWAVNFENGRLIGRIQHCEELLKLRLQPLDEMLPLSLYELQLRAKTLDEQLRARS